MAIFKRNEPQPVRPRERAPTSSRGASSEGAISIIGPGMSITGDITTNGVVRIEGTVHGTRRPSIWGREVISKATCSPATP